MKNLIPSSTHASLKSHALNARSEEKSAIHDDHADCCNTLSHATPVITELATRQPPFER